jgi:hypothetical protein
MATSDTFCIVCKDFADRKYAITVKNTEVGIATEAHLCQPCYNNFIETSNNGHLRKFLKWARAGIKEI